MATDTIPVIYTKLKSQIHTGNHQNSLVKLLCLLHLTAKQILNKSINETYVIPELSLVICHCELTIRIFKHPSKLLSQNKNIFAVAIIIYTIHTITGHMVMRSQTNPCSRASFPTQYYLGYKTIVGIRLKVLQAQPDMVRTGMSPESQCILTHSLP